MSNQIKEALILGIPKDYSMWKSSRGLLKTAGVPLSRVYRDEMVLFDQNVCGLRKPREGQGVFSLFIALRTPQMIIRSLERSTMDLGILPIGRYSPDERKVACLGLLELPGENRGSTIKTELFLTNRILASGVIDALQLRGIKGFSNRLVAKLMRAGRDEASKAQAYEAGYARAAADARRFMTMVNHRAFG